MPRAKLLCVPIRAGKVELSRMPVVFVKVVIRLSAEVPLAVRMDWRCSSVGASSSAWSNDGSAAEGAAGDGVLDVGEACCARGDALMRVLAARTAIG